MLLGEWPEEERTGAALKGTGTSAQARKAFVAAAKAADIFVQEVEPGGKR